jgi:hypothetical protein
MKSTRQDLFPKKDFGNSSNIFLRMQSYRRNGDRFNGARFRKRLFQCPWRFTKAAPVWETPTYERKIGLRAKIDTTLGELIEAVSEVCFDHCEDATKAYAIASLVLTEMLKHTLFLSARSTFTPSPIFRREEL